MKPATKAPPYWRCVKNINLYCKGEPDWEKPPEEMLLKQRTGFRNLKTLWHGTCKHDPKTCRKARTLTDVIRKE